MKAQELVAWNLRRLRVAQGTAQELLAVDAEVDRTYISRLERAKENPTVAVLERLAAALGVSISEFFAPVRAGSNRPQPLQSGRRPTRKRGSRK